MIEIIEKIKWILNGKPMYKFEEYNCGCCGNYWKESFEVPLYQRFHYQMGKNGRTWGLCPKDKGCNIH